jgi:uncharacterized protein YjdB
MGGKLKTALVLFIEVAGLLAAFTALLLTLNFFNVLSLSSIYPKSLGFLPHLNQPANSSSTTQSNPVGAVDNTKSSIPTNFAKLTHEASDAQIKKYQSYAVRFNEPIQDHNSPDYISDGVFSGYDAQNIQVVTKSGIINLKYDANTIFQKYAPSQQDSGGVIGPEPYTSPQTFFKSINFGSVLQFYYSKTGLRATEINYAESIKPIP